MSFATAWNERSNIARTILDKSNDGWRVVGMGVNYEDPDLIDDHSGNRIESAYAEDDAEGEIDKIPASYRAWRERRTK